MDWDVLLQDPTGHSLATNPWAPKALLIALTVINSCLAWSAHQADTWWPWYMEHTHVINMNIGGQALDILLHHTESAQKNITVKAHTHSHIYSNIQTELNNNKSENSPNLVYKYSTELSILLQEVISMASPAKKSSVWPPLQESTLTVAPHQLSIQDTFWPSQCWKKRKHKMNTCSAISVKTCKVQTKESISQLVNQWLGTLIN